MRHAQTFQKRYIVPCAATIAVIYLFASTCGAQAKPEGQSPAEQRTQEMSKKYPGLLEEFGHLIDKIQHGVQFPAGRGESRLLALLPEETMSYGALPNYGVTASQALKVLRQELADSAVLRNWWQHGQPATVGTKVEDALWKFSQLSQYLGEEIVFSGVMEGRDPKLLMVAEVRKPGLKKFLQEMLDALADKSKAGVRVLDAQELGTAKEAKPSDELLILVRPDFVVGALDLATLRKFNARLDGTKRGFAATPFGQRIVQEYKGGVTVLAAADLQTILKQVPPGPAQEQITFQRSGFADMKYVVWEHKSVAGQEVSQAELSFTGPRHGMAAWMAKPAPLGSLDFVSPKAMLAGTVVLTSPAQIFEDIRELATASNPNAFATLEQAEQALKISLKEDLLRHLEGEITLELDSVTPPRPEWKAIFKVSDANRLQQTLGTLLAAVHIEAQQYVVNGGVAYYTVRIPSGQTTIEIGYAFVDGYLVIGSSRETVAEAVRLHRSGESLGKSKKFLAALPPGRAPEASGLLYQDPVAMMALQLRRVAPQMVESFAQFAGEGAPAVMCAYGEETAIREASKGGALDAGVVLVVAAIAIPNLLRSRIAANEASAVGSVRTVNTAQVVYATTYPKRGYAPNLASLGPDPRGPNAGSTDHAGLINETLANASCTGNAWCTKSGYHFRVTADCTQQSCKEYVVVATPVDSNTGVRSFCSTSDGVIRLRAGPPLTEPVSVAECRAWPPLQ
jgi:type II secretory pathway pseudopilin PulG